MPLLSLHFSSHISLAMITCKVYSFITWWYHLNEIFNFHDIYLVGNDKFCCAGETSRSKFWGKKSCKWEISRFCKMKLETCMHWLQLFKEFYGWLEIINSQEEIKVKKSFPILTSFCKLEVSSSWFCYKSRTLLNKDRSCVKAGNTRLPKYLIKCSKSKILPIALRPKHFQLLPLPTTESDGK